MDNPVIAEYSEEILKGGNLVFRVGGRFVHEDSEIRRVWEVYKSEGGAYIGQCLVTGEIAPIARLHPSLKRIRELNSSGASLVSFNAQAYESYNREDGQGLNSPVSEKAAFAYTTALNYLLSPENREQAHFHRRYHGGLLGGKRQESVCERLHAACSSQKRWVASQKQAMFSLPGTRRPKQIWIRSPKGAARRKPLDLQSLTKGWMRNPLSTSWVWRPMRRGYRCAFSTTDPFEKIVRSIMEHYEDLKIVKEYRGPTDYIPFRI